MRAVALYPQEGQAQDLRPAVLCLVIFAGNRQVAQKYSNTRAAVKGPRAIFGGFAR